MGLTPIAVASTDVMYCYARPTHSYLNLSPGLLILKANHLPNLTCATVLAKELLSRTYVAHQIVIGSATDAYLAW